MKEGREDRIVDKLTERYDRGRQAIRGRYHNTKPFRKEPISEDEQLWAYDQMTYDNMTQLIEKYGQDEVGRKLQEMETLKMRRGTNA